jgi:hypothetical protein
MFDHINVLRITKLVFGEWRKLAEAQLMSGESSAFAGVSYLFALFHFSYLIVTFPVSGLLFYSNYHCIECLNDFITFFFNPLSCAAFSDRFLHFTPLSLT